MTYFNGTLHGYNNPVTRKYEPPIKTTAIYCDNCAVDSIPLDKSKPEGRQHWDTDFRWCPVFGGNEKCHKCGVAV